MLCPYCGQKHPDSAKFCPNTGLDLTNFLHQPIPTKDKLGPRHDQFQGLYWLLLVVAVLLLGGGVFMIREDISSLINFSILVAPPVTTVTKTPFKITNTPLQENIDVIIPTNTPSDMEPAPIHPSFMPSPVPLTPEIMLTSTPIPSETAIKNGDVQISPDDGMNMVLISAGEFLRGLSEENRNVILALCPDCDPNSLSDQIPQQSIYLDSFWIDQTEITNVQFAKFVSETGYTTIAETKGSSYVMFKGAPDFEYVEDADWRHPSGPSSNVLGKENYPVTQVSWDDARAYCKWAGRRLPTESEWEKAARGINGRLFPWGNEVPNSGLLNFNYELDGPTAVASYSLGVSPFGIFDMAGNVWEWVSDFYDENYYKSSPNYNPTGPVSGDGHPLRGGSWASDYQKYMQFVTTTYRLWNKPYIRSNVIGFRCAQSLNPTR